MYCIEKHFLITLAHWGVQKPAMASADLQSALFSRGFVILIRKNEAALAGGFILTFAKLHTRSLKSWTKAFPLWERKGASTVGAEYSFDVWGRRRNPADWSYNLSGQPYLVADRGFTGHEYLKYFNVYNMNGRLYDPLVGRFLSADNFVQDPSSTQNYNRYSYCLNNPLRYTDPSGWLKKTRIDENEPIDSENALFAYFNWMTDVTNDFNFSYEKHSSGGASGYYYRDGRYYDRKSGVMVNFEEVQDNYITPNILRNQKGAGDRLYEHESSTSSGYSSGIMIDGFRLNGRLYEFNVPVPYNFVSSTRSINQDNGFFSAGSKSQTLMLLGIGLSADWAKAGANIFQHSNLGVLRAAVNNDFSTATIKNIMRSTSKFSSEAELVGRRVIVLSAGISIYQGFDALARKDQAGVNRAALDLIVGLGTSTVGGVPGVLLYGTYMLLMDPLPGNSSGYGTPFGVRDATYVATSY